MLRILKWLSFNNRDDPLMLDSDALSQNESAIIKEHNNHLQHGRYHFAIYPLFSWKWFSSNLETSNMVQLNDIIYLSQSKVPGTGWARNAVILRIQIREECCSVPMLS